MTAMNTWLRALHEQITQLQSVPPCECAAAIRAGVLQSAFERAPPVAGQAVEKRTASDKPERAEACLESTLQSWCHQRGVSGAAVVARAQCVEPAAAAESPTAHMRPAPLAERAPADASCSTSLRIPRQLFASRAQPASAGSAADSPAIRAQGGAAPTGRSALSSALESALQNAAKQKAAAAAVLTSPASHRSGTPAWAADLENSNPNSPLHARAEPGSLWPHDRAAASDAGDSDAQLLSLQHSLASAATEQQGLVEAVQLQFARTQERVVAAALELDALQAELEAVREQARRRSATSAPVVFVCSRA